MSDVEVTPLEAIPEGSVVTEEMIEMWAKHFEIELNADTRPGVIGQLITLEAGYGTLPSALFDDGEGEEIMKPLRDAYFLVHGQENVPDSVPNAEVEASEDAGDDEYESEDEESEDEEEDVLEEDAE